MIIRKLTASFGCLQNAELELHEGLNIISAPNESGKSTWCAFIRAMLYGIDSAQRERGGMKPDKLKYAPWSGAAMSGEMEIEHEGKRITLRRSSKNASAPMREFSAVYTGTATPVPGFSGTEAGLLLTGMPKAVFESSVFVRQAGLAVSGSPELEKRISAIVSGGGEDSVSYTDADAALRAWLRRRRHNRSGAIPAIEAEIAAKRAAMEAMDEAAAERAALEEQLAAATEAEARAGESSDAGRSRLIDRVEQARRKSSEAESLRAAALEKAMRAEAETEKGPFGGMSAAEALSEGARDAELLTELRAKVPNRIPEIILGLAAALSLIAASVFDFPFLYGAAGIFFMVGLIYAALRNGKKKEAAAYAFAIVQRYNRTDGEGIMALAEEHVRTCAAAEKAQTALESAEAEAERAREALRGAENELLRGSTAPTSRRESELLRQRLALTEGRLQAMGDPMVLATELDALQSRRAELCTQYEALTLAIDTLREANDELQQRFAPALGRRAGEIMARLTGGKYAELSFDRSLDATAKRSGDTVAREKAYLSEGTADQLYLALRLAVCELALPEGCSCPLILDDALVNFDDERMGLAMELLLEISERRQVILFSCHDREMEYLARRKG